MGVGAIMKKVSQDLKSMLPPSHRDWPGVWFDEFDDNVVDYDDDEDEMGQTIPATIVHLKGFITGPEDSPYAGGVFRVVADIHRHFPRKCANFTLTTPIWHPNIGPTSGRICLDTLTDNWHHKRTLGFAMLSIRSLLTSPEPNDPLELYAAEQLKMNPLLYEETVKYWTYHYAIEESRKTPEMKEQFADKDDKVKKLAQRHGVDFDRAIYALSGSNWNFEDTVRRLLPRRPYDYSDFEFEL